MSETSPTLTELTIRPSSRGTSSSHGLPFLVRFFDLAIYGSTLLNGRVRSELNSLSLVLIVVAVFDWLAWSFLINGLLQPEVGVFDWKSPIAGGLAAVVTSMVLLFERQFVTMDLTRDRLKVAIRLALRILVIVGAAVATAKPVEVVAFQPAIQERAHQEQLTAYAFHLIEKLEDLENRKISKVDLQEIETCRTSQELTERTRILETELKPELNGARDILNRTLQDLAQAKRELNGLRASSRPEDLSRIAELSQRISGLEARRTRQEKILGNAQVAVSKHQKGLDFDIGLKPTAGKDCEAAIVQADKDYEEKQAQLQRSKELIPVHLNQLRNKSPAEAEKVAPIELDDVPRPYDFRTYDFWGQLRVLDDLIEGRPAQWMGGFKSTIMERAEKLGIVSPRNCDEVPRQETGVPPANFTPEKNKGCDDEAKANWDKAKPVLELQSQRYRRWSNIVFFIAVLIPSLAIAIKLFSSQDLTQYYSLKSQAKAGNPEARRTLELSGIETGHE